MSIIAAGRAFHERAILLDECTIARLGTPTFDPVTGQYTNPTVAVYSGACHIAPFTGARTLDEEFGGEIVVTRNYSLKLPYTATAVRKEDVVTITSSEDPGLVGAVFRVDQVDGETHQMSRRIICEKITGTVADDSSSEESSSEESSSS